MTFLKISARLSQIQTIVSITIPEVALISSYSSGHGQINFEQVP
jgi:hypothetical protein